MILKKPYALLMKYYRIIHMVLFGLLSYCTIKYTSLIGFFSDYIKNGYTTSVVTDLEKVYTPVSLLIVIIIIIALLSMILILLNHKKKPYSLYLFMLFYYTICLSGVIYLSFIFKSIEYELISSTLSRSLRDILIIIYLPQFIFYALIVVRIIGFDIKKFDFTSAKNEFLKDNLDSEEIEVNFNFDPNKVKIKVNRFLREIIYYLKENKFILVCIAIALIIYGGVYIYKNTHANYDKIYSMKKQFIYNDLNITYEDAILTNVDYNGRVIDPKYYYYVVKMNVINKSGTTINLDFNKFKLTIGEKIYDPVVNVIELFQDFASAKFTSSFSPNANKTFGIAYQIPIKEIDRNATIKIYTGSVYDKGEYLNKKILVNLKAKKVAEKEIVGNFSPKDEVDFIESGLKNSKLVVENYLITKSYNYTYQNCEENNSCVDYINVITPPLKDNRHDNRLLIMKIKLDMDSESLFFKEHTSAYLFGEYFCKIQYKIDEDIYKDKFINVTPQDNDNLLVFEVPKNIQDASIIQLIITIRDKEYIVNLKV